MAAGCRASNLQSTVMEACPESLEKIFQRVEEETERRAQEQSPSPPESPEKTLKVKSRHRGSVSISRFGQLSDDFTQVFNATRSATPTPSRISPLAERSRFFTKNRSVDSLTSDKHSDDEDGLSEDSHHVTQMQQIVGRKTTISRAIGGLIPGRLSHTRSRSIIDTAVDSSMVIGVFVEEEATTENAPDDLPPRSGSVMVVHSLRNQPSRCSFRRTSLMAKAKEFTQKFRRRSNAELSVTHLTS
ncbi:uncharacterized protein BT62DRAFT_609277 [Guyanagaster necrorhizus]|uniref:Uncharacterized protein n=1 Tax=Guyanagaster necrorhizus TaxID=856835 RepID=A0A9P7VZX1_9AGAR|nr:uncharacterized protein BT62DRAFT_609277 [Guyanagaster necrorhizus MCA 3950]KAG7449830.1 hypothetical protein BT62DRAFT_609277 [Guyanagaster necrorhizus MCA 3950]